MTQVLLAFDHIIDDGERQHRMLAITNTKGDDSMVRPKSSSTSKRLKVGSILDLARIVKQRRDELGWSILQLAETAGTSRFFVSDLENGKPTCQFDKIMDVLGALQLKVELRASRPVAAAAKPAESSNDERRALSLGPAIPIESTHSDPEKIGCLECGRQVRSLPRHLLSAHSMRSPEYRRRWRLPAEYDMRPTAVAAEAETRRKVKNALKAKEAS
ncbi:MucR family transcriptional regulator [Erythrobacter aureus]|nr:MucR family transcriptional regulator [Erythrobacter aureus]